MEDRINTGPPGAKYRPGRMGRRRKEPTVAAHATRRGFTEQAFRPVNTVSANPVSQFPVGGDQQAKTALARDLRQFQPSLDPVRSAEMAVNQTRARCQAPGKALRIRRSLGIG